MKATQKSIIVKELDNEFHYDLSSGFRQYAAIQEINAARKRNGSNVNEKTQFHGNLTKTPWGYMDINSNIIDGYEL